MKIFHRTKDLRTNPREPEHMRVLLALYWRITLICGFVLGVCIFLYGGWQIMDVMSDTTTAAATDSGTSTTTSSTSIQSGQIDGVLGGFTARQAQFESEKASTAVIKDPTQ